MTTINTAIYDAFKEAGVSEEQARAAAVPSNDLVTKADLKAELLELETRMTWRMITLMVAGGSIYTAIILMAVNYMIQVHLG